VYINFNHVLSLNLWSTVGSVNNALEVAQFGIAVVIILEYSFFIWDLKNTTSTQPVETAITTYKRSPQCQAVQKAVKNAIKDRNALRDIFQTNLEKTFVQIVLDNLLSKDNIKAV